MEDIKQQPTAEYSINQTESFEHNLELSIGDVGIKFPILEPIKNTAEAIKIFKQIITDEDIKLFLNGAKVRNLNEGMIG